eukprot:10438492-Karenia_brevis.AAC.1
MMSTQWKTQKHQRCQNLGVQQCRLRRRAGRSLNNLGKIWRQKHSTMTNFHQREPNVKSLNI